MSVHQRLEQESALKQWSDVKFADILHDENARLGIKSKVFMTVLRHTFTGMKVRCSSLSSCRLLIPYNELERAECT